jgi:eukaryotic-like serine/threonine-protein kinase
VRLAGRYRITERLGEGGGGTVWRAVDELLHRDVAVKQVRAPSGLSHTERAEYHARAIHEARAAGRLSHPSIVMVHDVVMHGDEPWIVMDLVPGRSLDKVIREDGPLPERRVAEIGLSVLDALQAAHARGILHRDVKPANVLIGPDGRALLTDFGIAVPAGRHREGWADLAGSPGYMAPERLRGEPEGPASDLWSLAATLYTAVEGEPPFHRSIAAAIAAAVLLHDPRPMVRASPRFAQLLLAMLDKDPARRPAPQVVRRVLEELAAGPEEPGERPRARLGRLLLGGALVLATGVAAGLGAWRLTSSDPPADAAGRFTAIPEPCRSLTRLQIQELLGTRADSDKETAGCRWIERVSGENRTLIVRYRIPSASVRAAAAELAAQRAAHPAGSCSDRPGLADEAFVCDAPDPASRTATGTTVVFRTSNLIVHVAYGRDGDRAITPGDRSVAIRAAELIRAGLG